MTTSEVLVIFKKITSFSLERNRRFELRICFWKYRGLKTRIYCVCGNRALNFLENLRKFLGNCVEHHDHHSIHHFDAPASSSENRIALRNRKDNAPVLNQCHDRTTREPGMLSSLQVVLQCSMFVWICFGGGWPLPVSQLPLVDH